MSEELKPCPSCKKKSAILCEFYVKCMNCGRMMMLKEDYNEEKLIEIFTDPGDVVIDPCCGSGSTLRAAAEIGRSAFGFEIDRNFYQRAKNEMIVFERDNQISFEDIPGVMP